MLSTMQGLNAYESARAKVPSKLDAATESKLKEQTDAFEAILLKTLLDEAMPKDNPLFPKEAGHEIYQALYTETLSNQLAGSFGYSELLLNYLKERA